MRYFTIEIDPDADPPVWLQEESNLIDELVTSCKILENRASTDVDFDSSSTKTDHNYESLLINQTNEGGGDEVQSPSVRAKYDSKNIELGGPMLLLCDGQQDDPNNIQRTRNNWRQGLDALILIWITLRPELNSYINFEMRSRDETGEQTRTNSQILIEFHADEQCDCGVTSDKNDIASDGGHLAVTGDNSGYLAINDDNGGHLAVTDDNGEPLVVTNDNSDQLAVTDDIDGHFAVTDDNVDHLVVTDDNVDHLVVADDHGGHLAVTDDNGDHFSLVDDIVKDHEELANKDNDMEDSVFHSDVSLELTSLKNREWAEFEKLIEKMSTEEIGELFLRLLEDLFQTPCMPETPEVDPPAGGWSIWDYVPIVGSVRSMMDASKSAKEGDTKGLVINSILGVGGLALDILTVVTGAAAVSSAVKIGAQIGAREVAKAVAKGVAKGAAKSAAINGAVGAGIGGLKDGTSGAVQGGIRGVAGGLVSGGLSGGSKGAVRVGQNAVLASGVTAREAVSAIGGSVNAGRKTARVVKMTAKIAKQVHERNDRAYDLLRRIVRNACTDHAEVATELPDNHNPNILE